MMAKLFRTLLVGFGRGEGRANGTRASRATETIDGAPSHRGIIAAAALLAAVLAAPSALAGAGDLDPTFGDGGKVVADMGAPSENGVADAAVIEPDGKIVVVGGSSAQAPELSVVLARYNPDGSLDPTFADNGILLSSTANFESYQALALQPDGKIVIAGYARTASTDWDFAVARYNPDGSLDTGFGPGGMVTTDFAGGSSEAAYAVIVLADGRIVVGGAIRDADNPYLSYSALAGYRPDGRLDQGFGQGGKVVTPGMWRISNFALQTDGKILAAADVRLARYNPDGSLDGSFGDGGMIVSGHSAYADVAVVVQADGRIVTSGYLYSGLRLARHDADGSPDTGFGTDGIVDIEFDGYWRAEARGVAVQDDGRIVAAGVVETRVGTDEVLADFALARVLPDGSPDTGFGIDGRVSTDFSGNDDIAGTVAVRSDGRIVVAGSTWTLTGPSPLPHQDFALARYLPDGGLDPSFGDGGTVATDLRGASDEAADSVAIQADGKIVVAGTVVHDGSGDDFLVARFNPDGSLDTSFGDGGRVSSDFGSHWVDYWWGRRLVTLEDNAQAVAVQADGKILAAGSSFDGSSRSWTRAVAVARYNPDGTPDLTFGTDGQVVTYIGWRDRASASALAVQPDGRVLVAGTAWTRTDGPPYEFAVLRFEPDGSLDASFGDGGLATADVVYRHNEYLTDMVLQPDGRIVLAGHSPDSRMSYSIALARLFPDGSLDPSFGNGGKVVTDLGVWEDAWAQAVALRADGGIVVGGGRAGIFTGDPRFVALVGYTRYGELDTSFGTDGWVLSSFGGINDALFDIALQADGRILATGWTGYWDRAVGPDWVLRGPVWMFRGEFDFALERYEPDGSPDYTFGDGGRVTTHYGQYDYPKNLALQADGKIVLAGNSWFPTFVVDGYEEGQWDLTLARYEGVGTMLDELEGLVFYVQELAASERLNDGQAKSLQVKLQAAVQLVDGGRTSGAVRQLEAFMTEVEVLVAEGFLSPAEGQMLIDQAAAVVAWLVV